MLPDGNPWTLFAMYFCSACGFFVTWLPTYLIDERGLTPERSGLYAAIPLFAGAVACVVSGAAADRPPAPEALVSFSAGSRSPPLHPPKTTQPLA